MSHPFLLSPLLKTFGLVAILAGLSYAGHLWLAQTPAENPARAPAPAPTELRSDDAHPGDPAAIASGTLSTHEIRQAYAHAPQDANGRFKGRRVRLQGRVSQIEAGQGQVLLITLDEADERPGLRVVVNMAEQPSRARPPALGHALGLDCLSQGLLMGEPVLGDCRLQP